MMRRLRNEERGQALVIVVLAMVGLIAFLSLVIDGGMAFAARRQMQNAADAGALAGVRKLYALYEGPHDATDEQAIYDDVIQYALANGVADPTDVEAWFIDGSQAHTGTSPLPGNGGIPSDALGVEVTTTTSFSSFFAVVIGRNELGASAVAASTLENGCMGPYAVWGNSCEPNCGVKITGATQVIGGTVHSNSDAHLTGSSVTVTGSVEYCLDFVGCDTCYDLDPWPGDEWCTCAPSMPRPWDGLNIEIARFSEPDPAIGDLRAEAEADPDPACLGKIGGEEQTSCYHYFTGNLKHKGCDDPWLDGLYFVDGKVTVNGNDMPPGTVNITIVATGTIRMVNIDDNNLIAYSDLNDDDLGDLLVFSNENTPNGQCNPWVINISTSAAEWKGIVFAPYGKIDISGSNLSTIRGAIWGYTVNLSGSDLTIMWSEELCSEEAVSPEVFLIR